MIGSASRSIAVSGNKQRSQHPPFASSCGQDCNLPELSSGDQKNWRLSLLGIEPGHLPAMASSAPTAEAASQRVPTKDEVVSHFVNGA